MLNAAKTATVKHPMDCTDEELQSFSLDDENRPPYWLLFNEFGRRGMLPDNWEPMIPEDEAELDEDLKQAWLRMKEALI